MVSSRKSSHSRGFGIAVIATAAAPTVDQRSIKREKTAPKQGQQHLTVTKRSLSPSIPSQMAGSHSANTSRSESTPNTSENLDTECSFVSSSLSELEDDDHSNVSNNISNADILQSDIENRNPYPSSDSSSIDVATTSASTLRNTTFTKPSYRITSRSNLSSPRFRSTPNINHIHTFSNPSSPSIIPHPGSGVPFHHLNSATKLPRRRSTQQLTKRQKDKLYDDSNNDNDLMNEEANDIFMYNVPIASQSSLRMFQHANAAQSTDALKKAWNESDSNLIIPPSPLPGTHSFSHDGPIGFKSPALQRNATFNALSPTAQQLSTFYEFASHTQAEDELEKRRHLAKPQTVDPLSLSNIDDLTLASSEKLAHLSVSRPSWIPPKKHSELTKHEREFKKLIAHQSKEALKHSKHRQKVSIERTIADERLKYISTKQILSSRNCTEVRKYILITQIDSTAKCTIFSKLVMFKMGQEATLKSPFIKNQTPLETTTITPDDTIPLKIEELFPAAYHQIISPYMQDLEFILQPIARPFPSPDVDISKLPKIPALPLQTVLPELARIGITLLISGYSKEQVRDIIYWMHVYIFTVKFKESLAKTLVKPSVIKQFKDFQDERSILTVPLAVDVLLHLPNKVSTKCLELLIVFWSLGGGRGVKMLLAIIVCVVREYHFGWNNLQVIFQNKVNVGIGEGEEAEEKFFERVLAYYALL